MTRPKQYQLEGAWQLHRWGGVGLLADEMGLGKSLQALLWLHKNPSKRPAIIICPAAVKYHWERECAVHFAMTATVLEGRRAPQHRHLITPSVVIINYDILKSWLGYLEELGAQTVIIDEGHYIKNPESLRFECVERLVQAIPHRIILTGTPITKHPVDLWACLHILYPDRFSDYLGYCHRYSKGHRFRGRWHFKGARNVEELHGELTDFVMIRRLKSDVLKELPPKVREIVPVEIANRREYNHAANDFLEWLGQRSPAARKRAAKAPQLAKVGYLLRLCSELKRQAMLDWIDNFLAGSDEKLVVFTVHRGTVEFLHAQYPGTSVVVDGSVHGRDRQRAVDRFQKDKRVRLLFGNVKAAGVGITLTAAASCLFVELPWNPGDAAQAEDRIHRITQKRTAFIYYLVARGTVEEHLCHVIQDKQELIQKVLEGGFNRHTSMQLYKLLRELPFAA